MERLQRRENPSNIGRIKSLQDETHRLLEMEDIWWKHRAKRNWYKDGDQNTRFFHAWASQRRKNNYISNIKDEAGTSWTTQDEIGDVFSSYFQSLFSVSGSMGLDACLELVQPRVTQVMNEKLLKPFSPEEVDTTLSQMQPLKAPGPDGFSVCFYQQHWAIVGDAVRRMVLNFLNSRILDSSLNSTLIALIPKVHQAVSVIEFRPISLCNMLHKLIAKVLANRLKKVLPMIISEQQSAFVLGRLITDNVFVAYETLHTCILGSKGRRIYGYKIGHEQGL